VNLSPLAKDHPLMRITSFLTSRVIPIFSAESYYRSSSTKSDDSSPTVDLSQLNFVTCARRYIRSTTSLLRLSPIKFHSEGKIDRSFDASCFDDSCDVFRPRDQRNRRNDFSYAKHTFFHYKRKRLFRITNNAIVYISNLVLFF